MSNPKSRFNKFVVIAWTTSYVAGAFLSTYGTTPELTQVGKMLLILSAGYMLLGIGIQTIQVSVKNRWGGFKDKSGTSGNYVAEAHIVINGQTLTNAQSATVRVALDSFDSELESAGLGKDSHGVVMSGAYKERISEIRSALYK